MGIEFLKDKKIYLTLVGVVIFFILVFALSPPALFPSKSFFTVSDGVGLYELSLDLDEGQVVRSPFWFRTFAIILGGERDMKAGEYYLSRSLNSFAIAWRIVHGNYDVETVKITIPEGFTIKKISDLFDERFPLFDHSVFKSLAQEGYLFPDTYFVPVTATASSTIKLLSDNFKDKLGPLMPTIESSDKSLEEIITMASILEGEAKDQESMRIISDILWKRIDLGIALQVDTSFVYINGKTTKDLTKDDLKIDSPYNTYLYRGLPPTPISNPGLESIEAALFPIKTLYLYFLTGDDDEMHYAKTFEEHKINKFKYLK